MGAAMQPGRIKLINSNASHWPMEWSNGRAIQARARGADLLILGRAAALHADRQQTTSASIEAPGMDSGASVGTARVQSTEVDI